MGARVSAVRSIVLVHQARPALRLFRLPLGSRLTENAAGLVRSPKSVGDLPPRVGREDDTEKTFCGEPPSARHPDPGSALRAG